MKDVRCHIPEPWGGTLPVCHGHSGADYVPALCTHRPSLLPIGCAGEVFGLAAACGSPPAVAEKFIKPSHLEEGEVVTRFP
jgi:hypothetical protein